MHILGERLCNLCCFQQCWLQPVEANGACLQRVTVGTLTEPRTGLVPGHGVSAQLHDCWEGTINRGDRKQGEVLQELGTLCCRG